MMVVKIKKVKIFKKQLNMTVTEDIYIYNGEKLISTLYLPSLLVIYSFLIKQNIHII